MRAGFDEVIAPHVIPPFWPQPNAGPIVEPEPSTWLLFGGNLEALTTPDPLDTVFAHVPPRPLQQGSDPPVTVTSILAGQSDNRLGQWGFVASLRRLVPLGPTRLAHQLASVPFTQSLFPSVLNGQATPLGT